MAKIKLLVDTDIIIDYLKGITPAKELFKSKNIEIYCSVISKKELLSKAGLSNSEKEKILKLLSNLRVLKIDNTINQKYMLLLGTYGERSSSLADYLIAATAWAKGLSLLTRNTKHFKFIKEIKLAPVYESGDK